MRGFYENAVLKVDAALRRGGSPAQPDRRSEIGSHATRMTAIFIRGCELEEFMGHFYENASLGSHGYCALGSYRGPLDPFETPTIDSRNESIVATDASFIDRGDLKKVLGNFYQIARVGPQTTGTHTPFCFHERLR